MILSFDASSDVQTGAAISRVQEFGEERGFDIIPSTELDPLPPHPLDLEGKKDSKGNILRTQLDAAEIEERFRGRYAQTLEAWAVAKREQGVDPDFRIVYCPLLPSSVQPEFDPAVSAIKLRIGLCFEPDHWIVAVRQTAPFSTSYNLVWTPEQITALYRTTGANTEQHVLQPAIEAIRAAYHAKKRKRLSAS